MVEVVTCYVVEAWGGDGGGGGGHVLTFFGTFWGFTILILTLLSSNIFLTLFPVQYIRLI